MSKESKVQNKSKKSDGRLRRKSLVGWGPLSAVLVTLGIYFGSQLAAGLFIGLFGSAFGHDPEKITQMVEDSALFQFVYILLVGVLTLVLLKWFLARRKIKLSQIGLGRLPVGSDIFNAFVTFGLYFFTLLALMAVIGAVFSGIDLNQEQQIGFESVSGAGPLILVFASLVLLPSIVEEVLVRGFLYGGLKNKLKPITAAIIASLIFAVAHLQFGSGEPLLWVAAIDTFVLSMFLIRLREKTGSLWSGMGVHFIKNSLAFTSLFILGI